MRVPNAQFYTGNRENWRRMGQLELPRPIVEELHRPEDYIAADDLVSAVNVALTLGQPLLVTGDPGTGKTDLALNVAKELGLAEPLKIPVKSSTTAENILYHFDAVRQFRDASLHSVRTNVPSALTSSYGVLEPYGTSSPRQYEASPYITYVGLGRAILLSHSLADVGDLWDVGKNGPFSGPTRSLVLIDEIDKADRDVPNDLLNEVDRCEFSIPELGNRRLKASEDCWPVVIFTSNAERLLPDAFLRRCIYYHIEFPTEERLRRIIQARVPAYPEGSALVNDAVRFLQRTRAEDGHSVMTRPPSTAELLGWLRYLHYQDVSGDSLLQDVWSQPTLHDTSLAILAKTLPDREALSRLIASERNVSGPSAR